jgi:hypothetical protein
MGFDPPAASGQPRPDWNWNGSERNRRSWNCCAARTSPYSISGLGSGKNHWLGGTKIQNLVKAENHGKNHLT